jgi:ABC-2 type transport system permease protein
MTVPSVLAPADVARSAGISPQLAVATRVSRTAARSGALWGAVFGLFVLLQTAGFTAEYDTPTARDQMAAVYGGNSGLVAILGQPDALSTVAGWATWRFVGILGPLGAVWGVLLATRLLRGEEDTGRSELLLAGPTTPRRAACQAAGGLAVGWLALAVLTALGALLASWSTTARFGLGQCVALAATVDSGAAMSLGIAAVASQLGATRRHATTIAGAVLGVAYALRMAADTARDARWLGWLSPLGWVERIRPLTDPHPIAALLVVALTVGGFAAAVWLAGHRDTGAAIFTRRQSRSPRVALLGGPVLFAVYQARMAAAGWLAAVVAFAVLFGALAGTSARDANGSRDVERAIGQLGGHGSPTAAYLGLTFLVVAFLVALIAAGQAGTLRADEASGQLDALLVRPLGRIRWLAGRLAVSGILLVLVGVAAGVGAWAGTAGPSDDVGAGDLVVAGVNAIPPGVFLLGVGTLAFGAWPRRTPVVIYGYLAWSFLIEFAGGAIHLSHWLLDSSVFFHMAPAPAGAPDWTSAAVLTALGIAGAVCGGFAFHRRDLHGL